MRVAVSCRLRIPAARPAPSGLTALPAGHAPRQFSQCKVAMIQAPHQSTLHASQSIAFRSRRCVASRWLKLSLAAVMPLEAAQAVMPRAAAQAAPHPLGSQPKQIPCLGQLCCGRESVPVCFFCGRRYPLVTFSSSQTNRWLTYRRSPHLKTAHARHVGCQSCFPSQTANEWKRCSKCSSYELSDTQKSKPKDERKCILCVASEDPVQSTYDILKSLHPQTLQQLLLLLSQSPPIAPSGSSAAPVSPPAEHPSYSPHPRLVPKCKWLPSSSPTSPHEDSNEA